MFGLKHFFALSALVPALTVCAQADTRIPTVIPTVKGAPVRITACSVRLTPPNDEYPDHPGFVPALAFTNVGKRVIIGAEFTYEMHKVLEDPPLFGSVIYLHEESKFEGDPIPPTYGGEMRDNWHFDVPKLRSVYCIPLRAAFADGGTWINPAYAYRFK